MKKIFFIIALAFSIINSNAQSCPDNMHPHSIDLGLPSGTKWACCNVGSNNPEGAGNYYAWSETEEKEVYSEKNRHNYNTIYCHLNWRDMEHNVAHVKWGGNWQMPTVEQFKELVGNCTLQMATVKGIKGMLFKGKNNASIFLPAAGQRTLFSLNSKGNYGYYWTEEQPDDVDMAFYFYFHDNKGLVGQSKVFFGRTVRPVQK